MKVLLSSNIRLSLSAAPVFRYDTETERLYVDDNGTIYRYDGVPSSAWLIIKGGDTGFLDKITEVMPYRIVPNVPKTKNLDYYRPQTPTVVMWLVDSSNIKYVGYDKGTQRLYVQFKGGDTYVYYDVEPLMWDGLRKADSKGSFLHWFVKVNNYRYDKIGGFLLDYSSNYLTPNAGTSHSAGYLTGF